ncbi:hypothetical protein JCM9140_889 [Halalkalibacter wakoensis JCM 9140]|uniref:Uncharacterized protein n=2 Tax=Halalkalibacter wakoensis TaxID=127891 RepID=W4Q0N6_9BACI|nr:hypothetical protein JCM9140_889 [Halalkalibacter wakoensis JCM 9140]
MKYKKEEKIKVYQKGGGQTMLTEFKKRFLVMLYITIGSAVATTLYSGILIRYVYKMNKKLNTLLAQQGQ